jgi:hypothetical protein
MGNRECGNLEESDKWSENKYYIHELGYGETDLIKMVYNRL